jgi:predicted site-specific integrase-resolvase
VDNEGKLKPHHITEGGHRYYSEQQINQVLQVPLVKKTKKVIGYCSVSSNKQKDDLARQVENVKTYMITKGYSFDVITDIEIIDNTEKTEEQELVEDLIQIGTVSSCSLQGKEPIKQRK